MNGRLPSFPEALVKPLNKRVRESLWDNCLNSALGSYQFSLLYWAIRARIEEPVLLAVESTQSILLLESALDAQKTALG